MCSAVLSLSAAITSNQSWAQLNGPSKEGQENASTAFSWAPVISVSWSRASR